MVAEVKFELIGLDEVVKKLGLLPDRFAYRGMRRATRKGAVVVRDAARRKALAIDDPKTANMISRNIEIRQGRKRSEIKVGGPIVRIGVAGGARNMRKYGEFKGKGKGNPGGDTWYWRLIEFGFYNEKSGRDVPANPFMRSSFSESSGKVVDTIVTAANGELDKEIAKLNTGGR